MNRDRVLVQLGAYLLLVVACMGASALAVSQSNANLREAINAELRQSLIRGCERSNQDRTSASESWSQLAGVFGDFVKLYPPKLHDRPDFKLLAKAHANFGKTATDMRSNIVSCTSAYPAKTN